MPRRKPNRPQKGDTIDNGDGVVHRVTQANWTAGTEWGFRLACDQGLEAINLTHRRTDYSRINLRPVSCLDCLVKET